MTDITLIIPAKKEKESLPQVLEELKEFNYEIMIVLHPTDSETINSIKDYKVRIIKQDNFGYGDALITGIKKQILIFCIFNADGSFKPHEIEIMRKKIDAENHDIIFGSRYSKNGKSDDDTLVTLLGNYIFFFFGKIIF